MSASSSRDTLASLLSKLNPFAPNRMTPAQIFQFPNQSLVFTASELYVLAEVLSNRAEVLQEMTSELVRTSVQGDDSWAITADQRDAAVSALNKVKNAMLP